MNEIKGIAVMICHFCDSSGYEREIKQCIDPLVIGPNTFRYVHVDNNQPWCDGGNAYIALPAD